MLQRAQLHAKAERAIGSQGRLSPMGSLPMNIERDGGKLSSGRRNTQVFGGVLGKKSPDEVQALAIQGVLLCVCGVLLHRKESNRTE